MSDNDSGIKFPERPDGGIWIRDDSETFGITLEHFGEGGILLVEVKPTDRRDDD